LARILFVSYTADRTGPTNSLLLLLKYLRDRYDAAVLLPGGGLFSEALETEKIPFFSFRSLDRFSIPAMVRLIWREGVRLVYGNNISSSSRNALIAAKLAGVPFICHVREIGWDWTWRGSWFLRFAAAAIAVSEACSDSVSRFLPRERLHVVYNGVEPTERHADRTAARSHLLAEIGLSADSFVVINVAHLGPRKGQEYAVEAMARLGREAPSVQLVLVGALDRDSEYVRKVRGMIQEMGLEGRVSLLGFRQDVDRLLQGADLYLHTATREPHARSVIEAMDVGLPVVAFAVDGVAETVVSGHTGYLIPSGDTSMLASAILKLAADRSLRQQLGLNGRRRVVQHFSAQATAQQVSAIMDKVLDGAKA
jgi:glycosyltransferase involved in cell wall biosynthesis